MLILGFSAGFPAQEGWIHEQIWGTPNRLGQKNRDFFIFSLTSSFGER
jgi:hypothetical protein